MADELSSTKWHENVRVKVVNLLIDALKEILEIKYSTQKDSSSLRLLQLFSEQREQIDLLMPQEIYTSENQKTTIDMALSNEIIFEFKSYENEFDKAKENGETKYWSSISKAKFFIVTNWSKWRIYKVTKSGLQLEEECDSIKAKQVLKTKVIPKLEKIKIPPIPKNVEALYKLGYHDLSNDLKKAFEATKMDIKVAPLYEAYKSIMKMLYGEAKETFFEELFIKHTYMHMITLASLSAALNKQGQPEDLCSGAGLLTNVDVALPYLNWWKPFLRNPDVKEYLEKVVNEVAQRANLIDWSQNTAEDVFRTLYEFLVEPEVRRELGEYYTPLWLVDMIIKEFNIKEKIVLDPFCGSGTFLVKVFHKKIDLKEDPDTALSEIVGFDINPLAVAVARAELVIAYTRRTNKELENPPQIYHIDTFAAFFEEKKEEKKKKVSFLIPGFDDAIKRAKAYFRLKNPIELGGGADVLVALRELEKSLTLATRSAFFECGLQKDCLKKKIEERIFKELKNSKNKFVKEFLEHFKEDSVAETIADLIMKHQGNDVWSVVLMSMYASILIKKFKPDIVVTNPPWIPVTEYKAPYSDEIREYLLDKITPFIPKKSAQIVNGADVAIVGLGKCLEFANEGVAFIMNKEQLFNHKSCMSAGIVVTYYLLKSFLKDNRWKMKLFDFDFDVFKHGIYPSVIVLKKVKEAQSSISQPKIIIRLTLPEKERYSKRLNLEEINKYLKSELYNKTFEEYIQPAIVYFTQDFNILAKKLNINGVYPKGLYIMGIFGGEKKKGGGEYAGLIVNQYEKNQSSFKFKLYNTTQSLEVPTDLLKRYDINIYKVVYMGEIEPFKLNEYLNVILSKQGESSLREFLQKSLEYTRNVSTETSSKIENLINELQQPNRIIPLSTDKYYTAYRCARAFTAFAFKPEDKNILIESHVAYIECQNEDIAYYYAAILNYLALKVIAYKRSFIRSQFARPLLVVYETGLSWNDINKKIRSEIVKLSKTLHKKLSNKKYENQKVALKEIAQSAEFRKIIMLLDKEIKEEKLKEALNFVSTEGKG
jgi:hypothetical protein